MIQYCTAESPQDLWQILELQAENLPNCLDEHEMKSQGFVTVKHDAQLLEEMNSQHQHIIAKDGDRVIGFALIMLQEFGDKIPVLVPMFQLIDQLSYKEKALNKSNYFVMGQICIDKAYRGQGVFRGLYQTLREHMSPHFEVVVTEIATRNNRSLRAHEKVGFEPIKRYTADGEEWDIVVWDWS